jgi:3-methyladenine DNA glycosylase AlkD
MDLMIKNKRKFVENDIHLLERLITQNSWWDSVDLLAGHLVGVYFQKFPEQRVLFVQRWDESKNMWLQRSVLVFQLKYKASTNTELLFQYCRKYSESKEFFIRKAIGWALRELAKTNPDSVIRFVNETQLSGLSRREALKHIKHLLTT